MGRWNTGAPEDNPESEIERLDNIKTTHKKNPCLDGAPLNIKPVGEVIARDRQGRCHDGHDLYVKAPERVDHGGDEDYVQTRHGDRRSDIRGPRQHLSFPVYKRTKGRLLIDMTFSTIRVPESLGVFVARNHSKIDTPISVSYCQFL
jgi:hypothetical protein